MATPGAEALSEPDVVFVLALKSTSTSQIFNSLFEFLQPFPIAYNSVQNSLWKTELQLNCTVG